MNQIHFWALGGEYGKKVQSGEWTLEQAEKAAKKDRDAAFKVAKAEGKRVVRHSSEGLRQYWEMGVPCGLTGKSYYINFF